MPVQRPCSYPGGCPALVDGSSGDRCAAHLRSEASVFRRGKTVERGYGSEHRRLRVLCFERDGFRCVDCGWEPESVQIFREAQMGVPPTERVLEELRAAYAVGGRHLHADHEIPVEMRPDLAAEIDNYRTRCNECHSVKTAREDGGFGHARGLRLVRAG